MVTDVAVTPGADAWLPDPDDPLPHAAVSTAAPTPAVATAQVLDLLISDRMAVLLVCAGAARAFTVSVLPAEYSPGASSEPSSQRRGRPSPPRRRYREGIRGSRRSARSRRRPVARCWRRCLPD